MAEFGCSLGTLMRALKGRELGRTHSSSPSGPSKGGTHSPRLLPHTHQALAESRTLFPTMVRAANENVFKSGEHSAKIGGRVLKGAWAGMPIYTVTLEERATCPTYCRHWGSCYGNNTPFARRFQHGERFEWRLERECAGLELQNPDGFVVRLHQLGDFYSWGYCDLWNTLLERHPALRVFGYTARIDSDNCVISRTLALMVKRWWPRFALRFSNAPIDFHSTVSIEHPGQKPDGAVICPAQLDQSESCSTCTLCWSSTKPIAFLQH